MNKTVQEIHVLGSGWDKTLGGDSLNDLIVNDMVKKLADHQKLKDKATPEQIKSHGKTMARLWKDAETTIASSTAFLHAAAANVLIRRIASAE